MERLRRDPLLFVEPAELAAHPVHALGERAELVAVRHDDRPPEPPLRHLAQEVVRRVHRQDERPRDHEAPEQGDGDGDGGEARHHLQRVAVGGLDTAPERGHPRFLGGDEPTHEPFDLPVTRLLPCAERRHRVGDPSVAEGVGDVGDDRHGVLLRRADVLDERALLGSRGRLEPRERVVEPVVLAQDPTHGVLVLGEERHGGEVHLHRERVLDLPRPPHALVGLIEQVGLA